MIERAKRYAMTEGKGVAKFLIVGSISFLIFAGAYALLTRVLFPEANKTLMNFLSVCTSTFFNYLAHRGWTYRATEGRHADQLWKYAGVTASAMALQSALFWFFVERIGVYDGIAIFPIGGICAMFTYFTHRVFTFRKT